jgi:hypothetical protein
MEEEIREKTGREKALEFAKNVPKPKKKVEKQNIENEGYYRDIDNANDLDNI